MVPHLLLLLMFGLVFRSILDILDHVMQVFLLAIAEVVIAPQDSDIAPENLDHLLVLQRLRTLSPLIQKYIVGFHGDIEEISRRPQVELGGDPDDVPQVEQLQLGLFEFVAQVQ